MAETQADLHALPDEQLVERYQRGVDQAYVELVKRYEKELFHFLIRFSGNRATAEDLFQEAFLQVHLSIDTFDITRRFKPWLFTIAANKTRDLLRKNNRTKTVPLSAPVGHQGESAREFMDLMEADLPAPQTLLLESETGELVKRVVDDLPDHLREVLILAYFHQFAYKEIADMLSIPLGTVKSRLHAAVGAFSQLWKRRHAGYADADADADEEGAVDADGCDDGSDDARVAATRSRADRADSAGLDADSNAGAGLKRRT